MKRRIIAFRRYYADFISSLTEKEVLKVKYILSLLETEDRLPLKFIKLIRDGLYEIVTTQPLYYSGKYSATVLRAINGSKFLFLAVSTIEYS